MDNPEVNPGCDPEVEPVTSGLGVIPTSSGPEVIEKLVQELKSQGVFDQFRNECLGEVDTKPAFQNLRSRVEGTINRYLSRQSSKWTPHLNKNLIRNQLRRHIQESEYLEGGVNRIVDQVVNPKILSTIEPEVESIICNYFGVDKPSESEELQNGNMAQPPLPPLPDNIPLYPGHNPAGIEPPPPLPPSASADATAANGELEQDGKNGSQLSEEKLSNISSEDIEMRSADEEDIQRSTSQASSSGLKGMVSPLTPPLPKKAPSPCVGGVSPLTPPNPPPPPPGEELSNDSSGPQTPPLPPLPSDEPPPPGTEMVVMEDMGVAETEVVTAGGGPATGGGGQSDMSPVSDTDFGDISPPKDSPRTPSESELPSPPGGSPAPQQLFVPPPPPPMTQPQPRPPSPPAPPPPPPPSGRRRPPSPLTSPIGSSSDDMDVNSPAPHMPAPTGARTPPGPPPSDGDHDHHRRSLTTSSVSGPSDISDTDLPAFQSSASDSEAGGQTPNIGELEREREALRAKLAKASMEDESEGEIRSDEEEEGETKDSDYMAKFQEIMNTPPDKDDDPTADTSPISDSLSPLAMSEATKTPSTPKVKSAGNSSSSSEESDAEKEKKGDEKDKSGNDGKKDDDSDNDGKPGGGSGGIGGAKDSVQEEPPPKNGSPKEEEEKKTKSERESTGGEGERRKSSSGHSSSSSKRREERRSSDSRHRSSSSKHHDKHKSSSSHRSSSKHHQDKDRHGRRSSSSKDDKSSSKDDKSSSRHDGHHHRKSSSSSKHHDKDKSSSSSSKDKAKSEKEKEKERERRDAKKRIEKIDQKIREKSSGVKSDKFQGFDMFAPKPPKAKTPNVAPYSRPGSVSSVGSASPLTSFGSKSPASSFGSKSPLAWGSKTPPAFGRDKSRQDADSSFDFSKTSIDVEKLNKVRQLELWRQKRLDENEGRRMMMMKRKKDAVESPLKVRKTFPEVPRSSKVVGDKLQQHEEDMMETKKRLEEARLKKYEEKKKAEEMKFKKRRRSSNSFSESEKNRTTSESSSSKKKKKQGEKKAEKEKAKSPAGEKAKKAKLTMADLESDEDEVSDWSDDKEDTKRRKRRRIVSEDEEDEGQPQTRKNALKAKADSILNSDPATPHFRGFEIEEKDDDKSASASSLERYCQDFDNVSVSSFDLDECDRDEDIFIDGLADPEAARDLFASFGGHPEVVPPCPAWLNQLLSAWNLTRAEVSLYDSLDKAKKAGGKAANKRTISEKTYNDRMKRRFPERQSLHRSKGHVKGQKSKSHYGADDFVTGEELSDLEQDGDECERVKEAKEVVSNGVGMAKEEDDKADDDIVEKLERLESSENGKVENNSSGNVTTNGPTEETSETKVEEESEVSEDDQGETNVQEDDQVQEESKLQQVSEECETKVQEDVESKKQVSEEDKVGQTEEESVSKVQEEGGEEEEASSETETTETKVQDDEPDFRGFSLSTGETKEKENPSLGSVFGKDKDANNGTRSDNGLGCDFGMDPDFFLRLVPGDKDGDRAFVLQEEEDDIEVTSSGLIEVKIEPSLLRELKRLAEGLEGTVNGIDLKEEDVTPARKSRRSAKKGAEPVAVSTPPKRTRRSMQQKTAS